MNLASTRAEFSAHLAGSATWRRVLTFELARPLRVAAAAIFVLCVLIWAVGRPLLLDPTVIGTDPSNYLAAGLRLNAGHELYALGAGDRAVPLLPPFYSVPLLSPPLIAVVWRGLALLPDPVSLYGWWIACFVAVGGCTMFMIARGNAATSLVVIVLAPWLALAALSGNVNCFLIPMLTYAWLAIEDRPALTGALIALAAALKVTPAFYAVWLVLYGDRRGVLGFVGAFALWNLAGVAGAGLSSYVDYLGVATSTGVAGATQYSLPGFLTGFGIGPLVAAISILILAASGTIAIITLRRHRGIGFAIATLVSVYAQPSLGLHSLALLLPGVAPYVRHADRGENQPPPPLPAVINARAGQG